MEIYVYAMEVVLLNVSLLTTLLLISIFCKQVIVFLTYLIFFVPLRIFAGGYHANRSEMCFCMSIVCYVILMIVTSKNILLFENMWVMLFAIVVMIIMIIYSPLESANHPLDEVQKKRNKRIVAIIVFVDIIVLVIFYFNKISIATFEIGYIFMNGILFWFGKLKK